MGGEKYDYGAISGRVVSRVEHELQRCPRDNGLCLDAQGNQQTTGMVKAPNSKGWGPAKCLRWCQSQEDATGCELSFGANKWCAKHTRSVARGNNSKRNSFHVCWAFDKCMDEEFGTGFDVAVYRSSNDCGQEQNRNWQHCHKDQFTCDQYMRTADCSSGYAKLDQVFGNGESGSLKVGECEYFYAAGYECVAASEVPSHYTYDVSCFVTGYAASYHHGSRHSQVFTKSAVECQSVCAKDSRCKYFNYQPWDEKCWFYDSFPGLDRRNSVNGDKNVFGPDSCPRHQQMDTTKIICPFLATLVNEGALPVRDSYTKFELEGTTVQAGIPEMNVEEHVHGGNFLNNPSGVQNIFNMEGAVNEHVTSTGIHDCKTDYSKCPESTLHNPIGKELCPGAETEDCELPNEDIFEKFWDHTDANDDKFIDLEEMLNDAEEFDVIDRNDVTGRGTITGGFQSLIRLLGVDDDGMHQEANGNTKMDKPTMQRINIDRRFPEHYTYPYIAGGKGFVQLGDWRFGPVSEEMHFSFSHRKTDRSIVFSPTGREYNSGGFNFRLWDEMLASGQYPSNVEFGSDLTFGDWRIGYIDNQYLSIEKKADNGVVFEAAGQTVPHHPGGEKVWDDKGDEVAKFAYFGDRFLQLGNFRLADAGNERFTISHSAFRDRGITMLSNGDVVEGIFDHDNDVWDRPVEGTCMNMSCKQMQYGYDSTQNSKF